MNCRGMTLPPSVNEPQMDSLEPMQVDDPESGHAPPSDFTVESPTFDLDVYANSYKRLAKIKRLIFVARHCPSLRVDALK